MNNIDFHLLIFLRFMRYFILESCFGIHKRYFKILFYRIAKYSFYKNH